MQRIKNWKTIYKQDINSKIKESEQEFDKYKLTRKSIYLRQAENKMFSAVKTFLMIKHNRRARSYQELTRIVKNDKREVRETTSGHLNMARSEVFLFAGGTDGSSQIAP